MKLPLLVGLFTFAALSASAQPSATMRPALLATVDTSFGYSSKETLTARDLPVGELAATHFALSVSGRHALDPQRQLLYGLAYDTHEFSGTASFVPDRLTELSLNLGWQQTLAPSWNLALFLRPGFYGDGEDFSGKSLNIPALFLANYTSSRELVWSFGLNANPFSDNPVLPILGVRWRFAPQWTFNVGFPRSGFTWQANEQLALRAGVGFQGGSFRVSDNLGTPAPGGGRLANTFVDYREVQAGLGADVKFGTAITASLDVGAVTDRKFDYFDREFRLDGGTGFYASVNLRASF